MKTSTYQTPLRENKEFIRFMMMYWEAPADMDECEFWEENKYDICDFVEHEGGNPEEIMEYMIRMGR